MILIYGCLDDPPLVRTVEALQQLGAPYVLLTQSSLDREGLCIEVGPGGVHGELVCAGQAIRLEQFHSIYARPLELPLRLFSLVDIPRVRLLHEQLFEWLDIASALVVNRPR